MSENNKKTILITGSTSGIGKAAAGHLHSKGYELLLTGRNEQKLAETSRELGEQRYVVCDL